MPSGIMRQYAPDDINMVVGTQPVSGVQEGTFIEAERSVDTASLHPGSDGEVTLAISPVQTGTIKVTLQQASPLNDFFNSLFQALQQKQMTVAVVPITINDKNGTTIISSKQSIVQKPTKVTYADKPEAREWTFLCPYLNMNPGGENSVA